MRLNKPTTLLLADDHTIFRQTLKDSLEKINNLSVIGEASNGVELLEKLKQKFLPDIIVLDLQMPEIDGFQCMDFIKKTFPAIKIIVLTGLEDIAVKNDMVKRGCHGFLKKDISVDQLIHTINEVIQHGSYFEETKAKFTPPFTKKIKEEKEEIAFSDTEMEVILFICKECTNVYIAEKMTISPRTVEWHVENILAKAGVKTRLGIAMYAIANGLYTR